MAMTSRSSEMGFPWRAISAFTFFNLSTSSYNYNYYGDKLRRIIRHVSVFSMPDNEAQASTSTPITYFPFFDQELVPLRRQPYRYSSCSSSCLYAYRRSSWNKPKPPKASSFQIGSGWNLADNSAISDNEVNKSYVQGGGYDVRPPTCTCGMWRKLLIHSTIHS